MQFWVPIAQTLVCTQMQQLAKKSCLQLLCAQKNLLINARYHSNLKFEWRREHFCACLATPGQILVDWVKQRMQLFGFPL